MPGSDIMKHYHYRPPMDNHTWGIICRDVDAYYRRMRMRRQYKTYTPEELTTWIRELIRRDDLHAFYICKAWLHLRALVLKEQHNECQRCKAKGLAVPATTVHHVKTVRRFPWLALTKSNLLALCDECHYEIHHPNKPKWNDERW